MILGHVIRLDPTEKQANALSRAAGVSRFAYNWALEEYEKRRKAGIKVSVYDLKKEWNALKREEFPWVLESPRDANSQPFADLRQAVTNRVRSVRGERRGRRVGSPRFRKKGVNDSFYVANDRFSLHPRGKRGIVRLSVIGNVRTMERLRWTGKILSGRVFRQAGLWYLAVNVEVPDSVADRSSRCSARRRPIVGVDLGLKVAATLSDGTSIRSPRPLGKALRRLRRACRKLHCRQKDGNNRYKMRLVLARVHRRVACVRKDWQHKLTTDLARENQAIVVEDLSMGFMLRNRRLSRAAADTGLGALRPMLEYKARLYGCEIVVADRHFPSTQRCSGCGAVREGERRLGLGDRVYSCAECGLVLDRDLNAAINLEQYPRLAGNWGQWTSTPTETSTSARRKSRRASAVAEVGTKPCAHVLTN